MYKVLIEGFDTKEQAQGFAHWYSGAGEQDAEVWVSEHTDLSFLEAIKIVDKGDTVVMTVKPIYK